MRSHFRPPASGRFPQQFPYACLDAPLRPEHRAQQSQRAAYGHHWRTAAMVYAWTYETEGGRPGKTCGKSSRFSLKEFSGLGVRGLQDRATVAKYRAAMQRAISQSSSSASRATDCATSTAVRPVFSPTEPIGSIGETSPCFRFRRLLRRARSPSTSASEAASTWPISEAAR